MIRFYFEGIRKDTTLRKSDMYDYILWLDVCVKPLPLKDGRKATTGFKTLS